MWSGWATKKHNMISTVTIVRNANFRYGEPHSTTNIRNGLGVYLVQPTSYKVGFPLCGWYHRPPTDVTVNIVECST